MYIPSSIHKISTALLHFRQIHFILLSFLEYLFSNLLFSTHHHFLYFQLLINCLFDNIVLLDGAVIDT